VSAPFALPEGATVKHSPHPLGGDHYIYKMSNGFGASVVRFTTSYGGGSYGADSGKWELAVLDPTGNLTYDTPITSDVIGWLDEDAVSETLLAIAGLAAT
jgi:hypothetical protein